MDKENNKLCPLLRLRNATYDHQCDCVEEDCGWYVVYDNEYIPNECGIAALGHLIDLS